MSFLSPAFLAAFPLVAIPVVLHLLNRRQQKRVAWGAMRFLVAAATRRRRIWTLTDLLLLLLRVTAFALLILALARPLLPSTWLGGTLPRDVLLVLDPSLSTQRRAGQQSAFAALISRAKTLIDDLSPNDLVRVVLAGESPEWLSEDPLPGNATTRRRLHAQLDALKPTTAAGDLLAAVREAADLEVPKDKAQRLILVLTDRQRQGWRIDQKPLWESVQRRIKQAAAPTTVSLEFPGLDLPTANLSVDRLDTPRPFGAAGQAMAFTATLSNHGPAASASALVSWSVNGAPAGVATLPPLNPGASTTISLTHVLAAPGTLEVRCQLDVADALTADNEALVLVDVFDRLPILWVDESGASEDTETDQSFFLAALGLTKEGASQGWRSVFEPTVLNSDALATADLSSFRAVVLSDVRALPAGALEKLERFVQDGGGLWIALGPRTEPERFAELFHRGGAGLAPYALAVPVGDPSNRDQFTSIRAASDTHPATVLLADFQRLDLDRARVFRRHTFDTGTGRDVATLIQAQGGDPVVVERKLGRGRVLVQAIPLGISWSTLPLCQAYVAMLHEWLWYLSEPSLTRRNLAAGDAFIQTLSERPERATLELPNGTRSTLTLEPVPGGSRLRVAAPRQPGLYHVTYPSGAGATATVPFQLRRDPRESNLAPLAEPDLARMQSDGGFQVGAGLQSLGTAANIAPPRHPLEGWFLGLLPCVILAEMALAGWTSQRRGRPSAAVSMGT